MNNPRSLAYAILRITLGSTFLFWGVGKFVAGFTVVAQGMQNNFAKTFLPPASVYLFAVTLPFFEVTAGSLLILGLFTRFAAALGGLLVTALTIGLTISGDAHGVALNLVYAMALFILLYLVDENELSVDRLRKRS